MMTLCILVWLWLLPLCVCIACTRKTSDRDLMMVTPFQAVEKVNTTPSWLSKPKHSAWIDPRTTEQYAAEHIPGAISLPFPRMQTEAEFTLKSYDQFIVYDTDYGDVIGRAASKRLMELGFDNVYTLNGGLKAWKSDGNEVQSGVPAPTDGANIKPVAAPVVPVAPTVIPPPPKRPMPGTTARPSGLGG